MPSKDVDVAERHNRIVDDNVLSGHINDRIPVDIADGPDDIIVNVKRPGIFDYLINGTARAD